MNILDPFLLQTVQTPDSLALIIDGKSISYADLNRCSGLLAEKYLALGLKQADVAVLMMPPSIDLYIVLLALFRIGAVACLPDPSFGLRYFNACISQVAVKAFIGSFKASILKFFSKQLRVIKLNLPQKINYLSALRKRGHQQFPLCQLANSAAALITFTSGSTGTPKGIVRTHQFLIDQHHLLSNTLKSKPGDIDFISLPVVVLSNLANGVTNIIPTFNIKKIEHHSREAMLDLIQKYNVNRMIAPPAVYRALTQTKRNLQQIRAIFTGGGPVFPNLLKELAAFAPNASITAIYGSTEAEPIAEIEFSTISNEDFNAMQQGHGLLAGYPISEIDIKIEQNEIWVSGQHVIKSYINRMHNAKTKIEIDGKIWHKTGDAGYLDANGRLWLLGRIEAKHGDLYPFCVETAALSFKGVAQAGFIHLQQHNFLAIESDPQLDYEQFKLNMQAAFGELKIIFLDHIPLDQRHHSKINYPQLKSEIMHGTFKNTPSKRKK